MMGGVIYTTVVLLDIETKEATLFASVLSWGFTVYSFPLLQLLFLAGLFTLTPTLHFQIYRLVTVNSENKVT